MTKSSGIALIGPPEAESTLSARVRVVSGARAGLVIPIAGDSLAIGRHTDADVQFSAEVDLEVSVHHAVIIRHDHRWYIRDLDSRNGTFIGGKRISSDTRLHDGDRIRLGAHGPELKFEAAAAAVDGSPTQRIRIAVARQTGVLRVISITLAITLAVVVVIALAANRRQRANWEREREVIELRTDSVLRANELVVASLQGELQELAAALMESQQRVEEAKERLRRAELAKESAQIPGLRGELQAATVALGRQQSAASLNVESIRRANRPAVALIYVESADGEVSTGTAFAVRPDATLLTSRHVVLGAEGSGPPARIAVQFSDSKQIWPARLLATSNEADLALVKIDNIVGDVPTVRGLNQRADTIAKGAPVAVIGFPLGGEPPAVEGDASKLARPILSVGVVTAQESGRIEVRGYGAAGASGSPIFDANGEVIAILFGGRPDSAAPSVLGISAAAALRFMRAVP
ncbi:MAG TPA: trypsin-like peptidase domain-containing protein [Longimicrobiaceae bacterium]|nr:trypsin-like peptidase domain-containing protein [Longimicrobiaceae bacterium]